MTEAADHAGERAFAEAVELAEILRKDPERLEARLPIVYEALDAFCEEAVRGAPIACKVGCTQCCHQWVPGVKAFEIERIARYVESSGDVARVLIELGRRLEAHRAIGGPDPDRVYARLGLPCVFLTAQGTCGIREIRPETCRTYFSFGPPERCAGDPDGHSFELEPHPAYQDVLARAAEPYARASSDTGELIRDLFMRLARGCSGVGVR